MDAQGTQNPQPPRARRAAAKQAEGRTTALFAPQPPLPRKRKARDAGAPRPQPRPVKQKRQPAQTEAEKAALHPDTPAMKRLAAAEVKRHRVNNFTAIAAGGVHTGTLRAGESFVQEGGVWRKETTRLDFLGKPMLDHTSRDYVEASHRLYGGTHTRQKGEFVDEEDQEDAEDGSAEDDKVDGDEESDQEGGEAQDGGAVAEVDEDQAAEVDGDVDGAAAGVGGDEHDEQDGEDEPPARARRRPRILGA